MRRTLALVAATIAVAAVAVPARATVRDVDVRSNEFQPRALGDVDPGDEIVWHFVQGNHTVTAWQGATFTSGSRTEGTFSWDGYAGGEVRYYCEFHGSVDGDTCNGMCGLITDQPVDVTAPLVAITSPADGAVLVIPPTPDRPLQQEVVITGTASDGDAVASVAVSVTDALGRTSEVDASSTGTPAFSTWHAAILLLPGPWRAEAAAEDPSGNRRASSVVSFVVV